MNNPNCRLLTLVGAGGIGKSRLAQQAAKSVLVSFPDGVYFVRLASIPPGQADLIVSAIANAVGFTFGGAQEPKPQLLHYLSAKKMLLLLDNFEHLLDGTALVIEILQRAPNIQVLVTSREPLNVQAEWIKRVEGLSFPTRPPKGDNALMRYSAVQLFVERANRVKAEFALNADTTAHIVRICQHVEGMPLALELAAAALKSMPLREISEQFVSNVNSSSSLRDIEMRHSSLRAVLDWSYALLSNAQQALFRRLVVFSGTWTLGAALFVCKGGVIELAQVPLLLDELAEKSLLVKEDQVNEPRYRMLEPVRQYAHIKLCETSEAENTQLRHLEYFVTIAEEAEPNLYAATQGIWLERLETAHNNLRTALAHSHSRLWLEIPNAELRLVGALWRFWYMRGYFKEGRNWLQSALQQSDAVEQLQAKAYTGLGYMAWCTNDYLEAREYHQTALTLYQKVNDKRGVAFALHNLGTLDVVESKYAHGKELLENSLALAQELEDPWLIACVLVALGECERYEGNIARAGDLQQESLLFSRRSGDHQLIALALNNLALVASAEKNHARARELYRECLNLYSKAGEKRLIAESLEGMAAALGALKYWDRAARILGAADALRDSIGFPVPTIDRASYARSLDAVRAASREQIFNAAWADGHAMTLEQAIAFALENTNGDLREPA